MDKEAWLQKIFGGAPVPGVTGASLPAPTLDTAGARADELPVSWSSSEAPSALEYVEPRWRPHARAPPSEWETERIASTTAFRRTLKGLVANTEYAVSVLGYPAGGGEPKQGGELHATTLPGQPSGVRAVGRSDTSVELHWTSNGSSRYAVYGSAALGFAKLYSGTDTHCTHTIGRAADEVARVAERKERTRRRSASDAPPPDRFHRPGSQGATPGPGEYEPNALGETQRQRLATSVSHTFKSRSVRALPWGKEAPADDENGAADGDKAVPGPGAYEPPAAVGTKSKPRAKGAIFGRTTSPRFVDTPADTPSPMHYFHNAW